MRRHAFRLAAYVLVTLLAAWRAQAGTPYTMEVLVDGRPLTVYPHRATSYVEALRSKEYEIRLTNHTGERVAVALAVDGLNSIDAKHTSARDARKWILGPWESVTIPGWQTSSGTARRFVFTTEAGSYGAWLNRTSDLGIVSAAFFRERPRPEPEARIDSRQRDAESPAAAGAPRENSAAKCAPEAKDSLAATGIGRQVDHGVIRVDFDEEDRPAAVVSLRYEYRDALVRLGVLPSSTDDALARRERSRGFASDGFAPDPYRGR